MYKIRFLAAVKVSLLHFFVSLVFAAPLALLVFELWYPTPLSLLLGINSLFLLLVGVDVVCGPILTFVLFDPAKSKLSVIIDFAVIALLQVCAALYGGYVIFNARPILVAFEGDRFRVVQAQDVFLSVPNENLSANRFINVFGPSYVAVKLLTPEDPEYLASVRLALEGVHPSFRPKRWEALDSQKDNLRSVLKPLTLLVNLDFEQRELLQRTIKLSGLTPEQLGYLPLVAKDQTDWIQLVRKDTGAPISILNINGWSNP